MTIRIEATEDENLAVSPQKYDWVIRMAASEAGLKNVNAYRMRSKDSPFAPWLLIQGQKKIVIKTYHSSQNGKNSKSIGNAEDIYEKEKWIYARCLGKVITPQPLFSLDLLGSPCNQDGEILAVTAFSYIEGKSIRYIYSEADSTSHIRNLGKITRRIHEISCKGFGHKFNPIHQSFTDSSWSEYIKRRINHINPELIVQSCKLTEIKANLIYSKLEELTTFYPSPSLFHHDLLYNCSNILFTQNTTKISGILDWEFAGSGWALVTELGVTYYALVINGFEETHISSFFDTFIKGYYGGYKTLSHDEYHAIQLMCLLYIVNFFISTLNNSSYEPIKLELAKQYLNSILSKE